MEMQWESHYNQLKRDIQNVRKTGKRCTESDIARFEDRHNKLDKSLQIIRMSPMEYEASLGEVARRTLILENLKQQLSSLSPLDLTPRNSNNSAATGSFGGGNNSYSSSSAPSQRPIINMQDAVATNPLQAERDLIRKQEYVMKQQDLALQDIEQGVGRLKNKALEIGEEVKVHTAILDNLDTHVDIATEGLKEETKHAEAVRVKGQVCYMYICVIIEIIIIMVMCFMFFKL